MRRGQDPAPDRCADGRHKRGAQHKAGGDGLVVADGFGDQEDGDCCGMEKLQMVGGVLKVPLSLRKVGKWKMGY